MNLVNKYEKKVDFRGILKLDVETDSGPKFLMKIRIRIGYGLMETILNGWCAQTQPERAEQ